MPKQKSKPIYSLLPISVELIERRIYLIRGQKVMLDEDLAELYDVETKALNRAVKRNRDRFPLDFMFQLTKIEAQNLRFQFGTSSSEYGGRRYLPYAFTQEGVAMLSGVLRSPKAIQVNVSIMRAFVRLRSILAEHKDLARKIEEIDKKYEGKLTKVLELINKYLKPAALPKPKGDFGFRDKR